MSILVTSDWHLNDKPRDRYRHEWQKWLRSTIEARNVHTLLMLGDLTDEFDNHPASLVNDIVRHIAALAESTTVYLMRGNHDYVDATCPFFRFTSEMQHVTWINSPSFYEVDGSRFLFLPHTRDYKADWAEVDFSKADLCFAHNTFDGTISESGQQLSGIPPSAIPSDLQVISGDIHKRQTVQHITYVGSPYTVDFGDSFNPRVLLLTEDKMVSIPCDGPQKKLIVADVAKGQASSWLKQAGQDIVKLRVTVGSAEAANWPTIKRGIVEDALKLGVRLHSIEAVMDKPAAASKRYSAASGKAKRDDQVLAAYCSDRGVEQGLTAVGLEIVHSKE